MSKDVVAFVIGIHDVKKGTKYKRDRNPTVTSSSRST